MMKTPFLHKNRSEGLAFFVGDIHGYYDRLMDALDEAGFDPKKGHKLFSVGDLIDRGEDSMKVLDLLDEPWFYAVRGNHDALMVRTVLYDCPKSEEIWAGNGGAWAAKYLLKKPEDRRGGRFTEEFVSYAERLERLPYLRDIKAHHTNQRIMCVHAEIPKNADLAGALKASEEGNLDSHKGLLKRLTWKRTFAEQAEDGYMKVIQDHDDHLFLRDDESHDGPPDNLKADLIISGHTPIAKKPVMTGRNLFIDTHVTKNGPITVLNEIEIKVMREKYMKLSQKMSRKHQPSGLTP